MESETFEPTVIVKTYRTYKTFLPLLLKFPKPLRYTLGQTIDKSFLSVLEYIFEANSLPAPLREAPLLRAQAKCDLLKILIRLSCEEKILVETQYFQIVSDLREISKMIGGWIKYTRQRPRDRK